MATKQVNIDIIAKDKTRQAMNSATKGVDKLKSSVFNLKNALIGLGAGLAIKSFVDVGNQVETLQLRLKFLFGSVEEGAKAFDKMASFASRVPFSLEQIQQGAGNLAVVSKDAEELAKMLEITGNVASVTGLDFRTTAEQIQRSFSAGIASADIFRERGVRDLLGFSAGATVSAEQTAEAFEKLFSGNGKFAKATKDMAKTLTATLSMIGDKIFNFQKVVAESLFKGLKQEFGELDKALADNQKTIDKIAKAIGKGLSEAIIFAGEAVSFLKDNFELLKALAMGVIVFKLATAFITLAGAIGKAKLALVAFSKVSKTTVIGAIIGITTAIVSMNKALAKGQDPYKKLNELLERQKKDLENLNKVTFLSTKQKLRNLEITNKLIEEEKKAIALYEMEIAGKKRKTIESKEYQDNLSKEIAKIKELEELNKKFLTGQELGQATQLDRSMSGQEIIDGGIKSKVGALREQMEAEFAVQKEFQDNHIRAIMENDALQLELQRIQANEKIRIDKETALKQLEIQKKLMKDNFEAMKTGQFQNLKLANLSKEQEKDIMIQGGKQILAGMSANNKKAFALNKAFNMAQAVMNTAQGVSKALATANIPMAFLIGAMGAVQIATIAKTKYQGRRLGGRMNQGQPYMVGEAGAELVVPDRPSNVVPNNKLGNISQPVNVNFNINTVDARGFNELLVNSRGLIINMINQAVNEKGRMAIV